MEQPTLAPAPHTHMTPQEAASTAEQTLRAHLLPHIGSPQTTSAPTAPSPGPAVGSSSPREVNPNIDPAISGVGVGPPTPQQQHQQLQQQQSQHQQPQQQQHQQQQHQQPIQQQPIQQQPIQHVIQQQAPQQMQQLQQMQQMPQQHPQSPSVQSIQMGTSPVMSQGMNMDQQHGQSQSGAEESEQPKARGGKRELSTSKRAAQNRAAQRAFRQRKEGYIKKLEEQVRDFNAMQDSYKQIQNENYQLRDYIINLQSRLIESQGEDAVPPPPAVLVHPAPPLMLVDTSQASGLPQTQPGQQAPPPPPQSQAIQNQPAQALQQQQQQQPQQTTALGAPTANMGVQQQPQSVLQVPQNMPITAAAPVHQTVIGEVATTGQKRPHDEADQAFLQSIAQAAGTTGNGFIATQQPSTPTSQPTTTAITPPTAMARKSSSPAAKRVKGEKQEAETGIDA